MTPHRLIVVRRYKFMYNAELMSAEVRLNLGETFCPLGSRQNINLGSWYMVPVDLVTHVGEIPVQVVFSKIYPSQIDSNIPDVSSIRTRASGEDLFIRGLAVKHSYPELHPSIAYTIPLSLRGIFRGLCLDVRLPDLNASLVSHPWLFGLYNKSEIDFRFFAQASGLHLPIYYLTNLEGLTEHLPALIVPSANNVMAKQEQKEYILAFSPDLAYQRGIEIRFTSTPGIDEVLREGLKREESLPKLQELYRQLSSEVSKGLVGEEEAGQMKEALSKAKVLTDDGQFVAECVLVQKARQLALVEKQIKAILTS